jgi:hypothetical protein
MIHHILIVTPGESESGVRHAAQDAGIGNSC